MSFRKNIFRFFFALLVILPLSAQSPDTTFRITPLHPVAELEKEALAAKPPHETSDFRKPELVELVKLDPTIKLDIRYATTNNFLSTPMYSQARAFLQRPAAEALVRASHSLQKQGYGLLVHDGYRPWYVTKMFWTPPRTTRRFLSPILRRVQGITGAARWI
jgi:zinc D-Ala-D-Ala dipeptidase